MTQGFSTNYSRRMTELLSWQFIVGAAITFVGLGIAVLTLAGVDDFRIAKGCFLVAALILAGRTVFWGVTSSRDLTLRISVSVAIVAIIALFAVNSIRYVNRKQKRAETASSTIASIDTPKEKLLTPPSPKAHNPERVVLNVEPKYLMGLFKEHTEAQARKLLEAYIGKWLQISGRVADVKSDSSVIRDAVIWTVFIYIEGTGMDIATLESHKQEWIDRVSVLRLGDRITVLGQLDRVSRISIGLEHCELIDSKSPNTES